jgi:hypothetical protein
MAQVKNSQESPESTHVIEKITREMKTKNRFLKLITRFMTHVSSMMKTKNGKMKTVSPVMKSVTGEIEKITCVDFSLIHQKINKSNIIINSSCYVIFCINCQKYTPK